MTQDQTSGQHNLKQLFDQFKFHLIYQNKRRDSSNNCQQLKNLLSQVKQQSHLKKERKRNLQENLIGGVRASTLRPASSLQSRIWKPSKVDPVGLEGRRDEIMVIEKQKQNLQQEIGKLQNSLSELKKNVRQIRKMVEIENAKQQKYKHISYLSKSIQRNTDSTKIINFRSFKKMANYQDDTLSGLKRFKSALRKENQQLQTKYIQKQQVVEQPQLKIDNYSIPARVVSQEVVDMKIDRAFINKLEELLQLFISKQPQFQHIKAEQTTKVRLKKIAKNYLKDERVKMHDLIQKLQEKYDVKMESIPNLILCIYKRLNRDNNQMENECIKRHQIKQSLAEDSQMLRKKKQLMDGEEKNEKLYGQEEEQEVKRNKIYSNSQLLVKFIFLMHTLLGKFKYLFTMAITLNMQKKNFHDLLIQIGNVYHPHSIFNQDMDPTLATPYDQITSFKEMQKLYQIYEKDHPLIAKGQFLNFIYSDLRYSMIFRREWIEQDLKEGIDEDWLLQKMKTIQERCEQIYSNKLKIFSMLLINSLKALAMNKYQRKIIANSNAKDSLFLIGNSHKKQLKRDAVEDQESHSSHSRENQKFDSEENQDQQSQLQFDEDPRKIVRLLQKVKNQQKTLFKPMIFEPAQVYMYGSKVVLPRYAV